MSSVRWSVHVRRRSTAARERHAVAVQARRGAERRAAERSQVVAQGERGGPQRRRRSIRPARARGTGPAPRSRRRRTPGRAPAGSRGRRSCRRRRRRTTSAVGAAAGPPSSGASAHCSAGPLPRTGPTCSWTSTPAGSGDLDRAVGAVVGDDVHPVTVGRVVEVRHRLQRVADHRLLVVGRHDEREAASSLARAAVCAGRARPTRPRPSAPTGTRSGPPAPPGQRPAPSPIGTSRRRQRAVERVATRRHSRWWVARPGRDPHSGRQ